jgi:hypothetical protein
MKNGKTLVELATELERQQEAKRDFVADTRKLRLDAWRPDAGSDVLMQVGSVARCAVGDHAHRQIGQHTGIHADYYDRMRSEAPGLLARNVNHWWDAKPETRMVRTMDDRVRGFLSDAYRPLDNIDLAQAVLPIAHELKAEPRSMDITERRLYLRFTVPFLEAEVKVGEPVRWGLSVSNSEVGSGSLRIEEFLEVLSCTNGMTMATPLRRAHLGKHTHDGFDDAVEYYSDATRKLDDAAFWAKCRDTVKALLTRERFESALERLRGATQRPITGDPVECIEMAKKQFKLTQGEQRNVLRHLIEGGDLTQWGLCNAITRTAEDAESFDRAVELEKTGSQVITLNRAEWTRLAEAA